MPATARWNSLEPENEMAGDVSTVRGIEIVSPISMTQPSVDHDPMSLALRDEPSSVEAHRAAVTRPKTIAITLASVPGGGGFSEAPAPRPRLAGSRGLCYHSRPCSAPIRAARPSDHPAP